MNFFVGILITTVSIIGGYLLVGGHLLVLWQPSEYIIIIGSAIGSYIVANPKHIISHVPKTFKIVLQGSQFNKESYIEVLSLLFSLFKAIKAKGLIGIESDVESPTESNIFKKFPSILKNQKALNFMSDSFRMVIMGSDNPYQIDDILSQEIETYEHEFEHMTGSLSNMADSLPALGIVAAVLGVIHTMGSINQPPEILGHLIGAALVGTFLGILISYAIVTPYANYLKSIYSEEINYYKCIHSCIVAFLHGSAPMIATEYGRKIIDPGYRPSFNEIEKRFQEIKIDSK